jgi:predicted dehydrogenase
MTTQDTRIPIVLIGLNFGRHIVEQLTRDGGNPYIRLAGLCDLDRAKAEALAASQGGLRVYQSLDEVLADPGVPAVGLFTGPGGRAALLSRIIRAGKDVITTKPFETDPAAAEAVLDEAGRLGRIIHLNSPSPGTSPSLAVIQRWRDLYDLGAPVGARAEVWTHYREAADGGWYDDPEKCPVAPVFRLGIYLINDLVQLFGPVRRVQVLGTRLFTGRPTVDNGQLGMEFANGALGNVFASFCVRDGDHYRDGLTLNFERGTVYRNIGPQRTAQGVELGVVVNEGEWQPRRLAERTTVEADSGSYDWAGFAAAVRREPGAPVYQRGHIVEPLRVIAAMAASARSGRIEPVHPGE